MQEDGITLYNRFLRGDKRALESLIELYRSGLMRFIYGYVKDSFLAEDILEDTFLEIYFRRSFKDTGKASFKTYLYTIARNKSLNAIKKRKRKREVSIDALDVDAAYFLSDSNTEERLESKHRKAALHAALFQLKEEYREVLLLRFFDGLSPQEIARITKRKQKQVYNYIARGKAALKELLTERGFLYEEL
jgi:RNA polymerase sigma-70 factor (ECF subfamily)